MPGKINITIVRLYDSKLADGTYRILVDRLWPRGVKKDLLQFNEWNKDIAPSAALRKWFDHKPERFEEFAKQYEAELTQQKDELIRIRNIAKNKIVTLLYAAKDPKINQAVVLKKILIRKLL